MFTATDSYHLARYLAGAAELAIAELSPNGATDLGRVLIAAQATKMPRGEAFDGWLSVQDPGTAEAIRRAIMSADPNQPPEAVSIRRRLWHADELLTARFPDPIWAVPKYLPAGFTFLAGRPKIGKSWLSLQLALAISSGGMTLGQSVTRGPVWYYALEDGPRRLQSRMRAQRWPDGLAVEFATELARLDKGGLDAITNVIERDKPRLVVIDTLARVIPTKTDQNEYQAMTDILGGVQRLGLSTETSIVGVDHHNKVGSGDLLADLMGSTGKGGVADAIWGLYRERGAPKGVLKITGRDIEDHELELRWDQTFCCWQYVGPADAVQLSTSQTKVLDALHDLGDTATTRQLARHTGVQESNISRTLGELFDAGLVEKLARIGQEVPYHIVRRNTPTPVYQGDTDDNNDN